jgi:hypothetical protein
MVRCESSDTQRRTVAGMSNLEQNAPTSPWKGATTMRVLSVNPILNVSDIDETISWFAKLGWTAGFEWRTIPRT